MELITDRLILREFTLVDAAAVLAYQSDPRYLRFVEWASRTPEEVNGFVQSFIDQQHTHPRTKFQLAIVRRETGRLIGNAGCRKPADDSDVADLGFELAPEDWGHGYATEAARSMVAFGFHRLSVRRIDAWCIADNSASVRVLKKLGMSEAGGTPVSHNFKGRQWDSLRFSLLKNDWRG